MTAPTPQPDSPSESRSQSNRQRQNGRFKIQVTNHSQWREKRRDGSPGATRRRLLALVSGKGKGPKIKWRIPDK